KIIVIIKKIDKKLKILFSAAACGKKICQFSLILQRCQNLSTYFFPSSILRTEMDHHCSCQLIASSKTALYSLKINKRNLMQL
ncbi:hypothetical protein HZS_229, partial [Henneguya salminicola]